MSSVDGGLRDRTDGAEAASGATLVAVRDPSDVLLEHSGTPVETLLAHHNLGRDHPAPAAPQLIVVTCMDQRVVLRMPDGFAFVVRTAGANVEPVVFNVTCAMAIRDVRAVAVIGHSDCAMVDVRRHRSQFVQTLTSLGPLTAPEADKLFEAGAGQFGCDDAVSQTLRQCAVLRRSVPKALISPLFFDVDDGMLYQIA